MWNINLVHGHQQWHTLQDNTLLSAMAKAAKEQQSNL